MPTSPISGYILAGGRSSRMGADKSLLMLGGKPLIRHAVDKLRGICEPVHILSRDPALSAYAPLVPDLHPGCGPIGGIEAALAHSSSAWNLVLPVDVPFLPSEVLRSWAESITAPDSTIRVAMFSADGRPQPAVCLLHRQIASSVRAAVTLKEYKLLPVLEACAEVLSLQLDCPLEQILDIRPIEGESQTASIGGPGSISLWFSNLNTPEDFALAQNRVDALQ